MLNRNRMGRRYLRESEDKITEDDIRDYIYGVAQSTADRLDFEIDYAIANNHWNDLDIIENGEVDAEMLPVRIDLKDDYAIEYKAIADWVDDIYYTYDFDMYAYVSKDFVLGSINGDSDLNYEYEAIEFMFGSGGSIKNVYMNDTDKITKEIYTRLEQSLKRKGIYDLVGQPKVELNESRKCKKYKRMIGESSEDRDPKSEKKEDMLEAIESFAMLTCAFPINDLSKQREIEKDENGNKVAVANTIAFTFLIENEKIQEHFRKKGTEEFRILFRSKIEQNGLTSLAKEIFVNDKLIARSAQGYFGAKKAIYDYFVRILEKDKFFDSLKESKRKSFRGGGYAKKTLRESSRSDYSPVFELFKRELEDADDFLVGNKKTFSYSSQVFSDKLKNIDFIAKTDGRNDFSIFVTFTLKNGSKKKFKTSTYFKDDFGIEQSIIECLDEADKLHD